MSVHDSYVVLGDRRSLPHDVVASTGGLRHRSSHSSGTMSPPAAGDAVLDLSASKFRYRYGTPGCMSSMPTTPTSGPPVFDQDPSSTSPYKKRNEEFIDIDSGFDVTYSSKSKTKRKSASELFDSVLMTPVAKLSSKLKKRPSFVDDESTWNPELVQVLGWVIFSLILVCLIVMFLITYATFKGPLRGHFTNEEVETQSENAPLPPQELPEFTGLQQEFLLDQDVTFEEVIEMKRVMEEDGSIDEEVFVEEDIIYNDIPDPGERSYQPSIEFVDPSETTLKAKATEDTQQIIEKAEEILVRETKLLEEVSRKLDQFVAHSKSKMSNEIEEDTKKVEEGVVVTVDSNKMANVEEELAKSKPRGKRTKNKNPLTKSLGPKMSKAKSQKLPTSTTPTSIQVTLEEEITSEGESDNLGTDLEAADEEDREEGEDYDYYDEEAGPGEERVKRSRSGSRFGRSRVRMMSFRKRSGVDKSRDSNDINANMESNNDD